MGVFAAGRQGSRLSRLQGDAKHHTKRCRVFGAQAQIRIAWRLCHLFCGDRSCRIRLRCTRRCQILRPNKRTRTSTIQPVFEIPMFFFFFFFLETFFSSFWRITLVNFSSLSLTNVIDAVTVTFPLADDPATSFVAWTTTPWYARRAFDNTFVIKHRFFVELMSLFDEQQKTNPKDVAVESCACCSSDDELCQGMFAPLFFRC